jgi:hypothetical protein
MDERKHALLGGLNTPHAETPAPQTLMFDEDLPDGA